MVELVKGKTTTMPEAHSGEEIFFVSRAADRFCLRSHRQQIEWNRAKNDVFVSTPRFIRGTLVRFEIGIHSRTRLEDVFASSHPEIKIRPINVSGAVNAMLRHASGSN